MKIPTFDQFIEPLLRFLAEQSKPVRTRAVYEAMAESMSLTPEQRAEPLPSRVQPVYENRIGWAHDRLKRYGYSHSPKRGHWLLTEKGKAFTEANPSLSEQQTAEIARPPSHMLAKAEGSGDLTENVTAPELEESAASQTPQDRIESGLAEIQASVSAELVDFMLEGSPDFFERLVLDVLHAMGYGTSRRDLQQVGRSGDGGIDGIISLDRLGLEKVYVQAKRWKGQVGSPEVQGFMGALQLQGANKGVLIACGSISKPARETASQARGSVVLIDGQRLASLMIEHGVGVTHEIVKLPKIDSDYFESE